MDSMIGSSYRSTGHAVDSSYGSVVPRAAYLDGDTGIG